VGLIVERGTRVHNAIKNSSSHRGGVIAVSAGGVDRLALYAGEGLNTSVWKKRERGGAGKKN